MGGLLLIYSAKKTPLECKEVQEPSEGPRDFQIQD